LRCMYILSCGSLCNIFLPNSVGADDAEDLDGVIKLSPWVRCTAALRTRKLISKRFQRTASGRVHRFCQGAMMKRQRVPGANESPARTTRGMVSIPRGHGADTVSTSRKTRMIPRRERGLVGRPRSTRSAAGARGACDVNRGRLQSQMDQRSHIILEIHMYSVYDVGLG